MADGTKQTMLLRLTAEARTALKVMAAQRNTTASALVESWILGAQADDKPAA